MSRSRSLTNFAVIVALLAVVFPPVEAAAQQIAAPKLAFEKFVLANGLEVVLHEDHATPVVSVNIWYHVGSKNERRGKTGFAHLFEHMMFQGSEHFDTDTFKALEAMGATDSNGTTNSDRTNYYETVPSHMLERTLWLEADRMGWLLPAVTQQILDNQREVVKNERRQGVENEPYGQVYERVAAALYPAHHPYSWPTIGSMDDLTAATLDDVKAFFREYYGPNNATLVVAGDLDVAKTKAMVERYFGPIPPGPPVARMKEWVPTLDREVRLDLEDRVTQPRLHIVWPAPRSYSEGAARLDIVAGALAGGKTSRLYKRLVYDLKIAQDASAGCYGNEISGEFWVVITAADGHSLDEIEPIVREEIEKFRTSGPTADEVELARTGILAGYVRQLERVGGRSDLLARFNVFLDDPGFLERDFARYQAVTAATAQSAAERWLGSGRVVARSVPAGTTRASAAAAGLDRAVMPAPGPASPATLPRTQRAKLSNGLDVVLVESHSVPAVSLSMVVRGGRSVGKVGAATFAAKMQQEGTATRTSLAISDESRRLGANMNATANRDTIVVSVNALKARLEPSIALWSDVLLNPAYPADELERARQNALGVITTELQEPGTLAFRVAVRLMYGETHPYGQPFSGTPVAVRAITRDDLVAYHRAWFKPNNATLVVVGDTTLAEMTPLLERALYGWKPGVVPEIAVPISPQAAGTTVYLVDKPGAAQSVILAGHVVPPRTDADAVSFDVLNAALGGQFISRLNLNLREDKGYTYGAFSFVVEARTQSLFFANAGVRTDVSKESLAEILRELRDIRGARPITADELRIAQSNLLLSLPGIYATIDGVAGRLIESVGMGLPDDFYTTYPSKVSAATVDGLTALAAKRIQPDNLVIIVVGDRALIEPKLRELKLGPIQVLDVEGNPVKAP